MVEYYVSEPKCELAYCSIVNSEDTKPGSDVLVSRNPFSYEDVLYSFNLLPKFNELKSLSVKEKNTYYNLLNCYVNVIIVTKPLVSDVIFRKGDFDLLYILVISPFKHLTKYLNYWRDINKEVLKCLQTPVLRSKLGIGFEDLSKQEELVNLLIPIVKNVQFEVSIEEDD